MKMGFLAGLVVAAGGGAGAGGAQAQSALAVSLEGRVDLAVPVGDSDELFETGVGFGVTGALQLTPLFGVYGGYSITTFDFPDSEDESETEGFEAGGRVTLGTGGGIYNPFFQIGVLFHDDDTGLEAGLGGYYPVGRNLSLAPMARYRTVDDLDYLTFGVGLNLRF